MRHEPQQCICTCSYTHQCMCSCPCPLQCMCSLWKERTPQCMTAHEPFVVMCNKGCASDMWAVLLCLVQVLSELLDFKDVSENTITTTSGMSDDVTLVTATYHSDQKAAHPISTLVQLNFGLAQKQAQQAQHTHMKAHRQVQQAQHQAQQDPRQARRHEREG